MFVTLDEWRFLYVGARSCLLLKKHSLDLLPYLLWLWPCFGFGKNLDPLPLSLETSSRFGMERIGFNRSVSTHWVPGLATSATSLQFRVWGLGLRV